MNIVTANKKILLLFLLVLGIIGTQSGWNYQKESTYITVSVQQGDTLWNLASLSAETDRDIRSVVQDIIESNHLQDNADIYPGQVLKIPVDAQHETAVRQQLAQTHYIPE